MSTLHGETVDLIIRQLPQHEQTEDGAWRITTQLGDRDISRPKVLADPFSNEERASCCECLDHALRQSSFDVPAAQRAAAIFDKHRPNLFNELALSSSELEAIRGKRLHIHVCVPLERPSLDQSTTQPRNGHGCSIHSLFWEHLEDTQLWNNKSIGETPPVTVRRRVGLEAATSTPDDSNPNSFNILLVVARKNLHTDTGEPDLLNPATIPCVILELQDELWRLGYKHQINLEIVRPGRFEELRDHLKEYPARFFDLVHFDMHGQILPDGNPYLMFNKYDPQHELVEETVGAVDLAQLLRRPEIGIDCVALSACKTAKADEDLQANLSWKFVEYGVSNVLAMSYNMPESMGEIFFARFYRNCS